MIFMKFIKFIEDIVRSLSARIRNKVDSNNILVRILLTLWYYVKPFIVFAGGWILLNISMILISYWLQMRWIGMVSIAGSTTILALYISLRDDTEAVDKYLKRYAKDRHYISKDKKSELKW